MKRSATVSVILSLCGLLSAQSANPHFAKVYVAKDGLAHLVDDTGKDIAIAKDPTQVSVDAPKISADGQFAGWEVDQENCCTSYPIPTRVAIYSVNGHHLVGDGLMIYDWCFVPGKSQVAISSGTVHGWTGGPNLHLYSAVSGKILGSWHRDPPAKLPDWSTCLKQ